jgi:hypothetical protein
VQSALGGLQDQDMSDELLYTGKIRKVLGGLTAFAEVTLRLDDEYEGLGGVSIECGDGTDTHRAAAVMGVCFALRQMERDTIHFSIMNLKTAMVDTSPMHCMIAAARAAWKWGHGDDWRECCEEDDDYLLQRVRESHENPREDFYSVPMLHQ